MRPHSREVKGPPPHGPVASGPAVGGHAVPETARITRFTTNRLVATLAAMDAARSLGFVACLAFAMAAGGCVSPTPVAGGSVPSPYPSIAAYPWPPRTRVPTVVGTASPTASPSTPTVAALATAMPSPPAFGRCSQAAGAVPITGDGSDTWYLLGTETPYPAVEADDPGLRVLVAAYEHGSLDDARSFFDAWADESVPVSDAELEQLDPAIRAAYEVIETLYAFDLGAIPGTSEPPLNRPATSDPYFVVPGSLRITCFARPPGDLAAHDRIDFDQVTKVARLFIEDYRPRIPIPGVRALVQTSEAASALAQFVCRDDLVGGTAATADGTLRTGRERRRFLEPLVRFEGSLPMDRCGLEGTPRVDTVWLSEDLSAAIVPYVITYHDKIGRAWLTRERDGSWRVVRVELSGLI